MRLEPLELRDTRALITGSSSGIGAALAVALAKRGSVVGICGRRADRLEEVLQRCQRFNPDCQAWQIDLVDTESLGSFVAEVESQFGAIDLLVNNAGIPKRRKVSQLTTEEVRDVMAVNYLAAAAVTLAVLPGMLDRGRGRIVNVASTAGRLGGPGEVAYGASKAALSVWSEGLAAELGAQGIGVQLVIPGPIDTEIVDQPGEDPPLAALAGIRRLPLEDAVEAILDHMQGPNFELWLPAHFRQIYLQKVDDPDRSIQQAAAWFETHLLGAAGSGSRSE